MSTPVLNSPQTRSSLPEPLNIVSKEHVNFLQTSLVHQLETLPKMTSSLQQIFHLLPILFRFLRKTLQSQEQLVHEYNDLSTNIQKIGSIFAQNDLLSPIGSAQYWNVMRGLEQEIERLRILLHQPGLLHIDQRKFQISQETQKIQLDRLRKENEKIHLLINQQTNTTESLRTKVESDLEELEKLKPTFERVTSEKEDVDHRWLHLEKQTLYIQNLMNRSRTMENEYQDRIKTIQFHSDLGHKQLNTLRTTFSRTNQKLSALRTNENYIKQDIQSIKSEIIQEQTRSLTCRDRIQNLRHQAHELELTKRSTQHLLKSSEHTNFTLTRRRLTLETDQFKLQHRLKNFTGQLTDLFKRTQTNERTLSINLIAHDDQQSKITAMEIILQQLIESNKKLEIILQENRFIRNNEREKLRSIKQISFQKRKQLLTHTKRLHTLSRNEHHLADRTIRSVLEILRLNNILHHSHHTENYLQGVVRKRKMEMLKREKQRASLNTDLHEHDNQVDFLTKKNQFIENELENKIDYFRSVNEKYNKQKRHRILSVNRKQVCTYSYQQKLQTIDMMHLKNEQLDKLSENEIHLISKQNEENEQLKLNIHQMKQRIINMISRNQRQIDEKILLEEKIRLYTQLNDSQQQQERCCMFYIKQYSSQISHLQQEIHRLIDNIRNLQKKMMSIVSFQYEKQLKNANVQRLNQALFRRPVITRASPMRVHIDKALEDYSIYGNRLMEIIHQCIQWREKLRWINQLYLEKIEQIQQQTRLGSTSNQMVLRYKMDAKIKQRKAKTAEFRLQTYS